MQEALSGVGIIVSELEKSGSSMVEEAVVESAVERMTSATVQQTSGGSCFSNPLLASSDRWTVEISCCVHAKHHARSLSRLAMKPESLNSLLNSARPAAISVGNPRSGNSGAPGHLVRLRKMES